MMSETTTRISDLPENITLQPNMSNGGGGGSQSLQNTYMPMNIHPNPYGPQDGNPTPINPSMQQTQQQQQQQPPQYSQQQPQFAQEPQYKLPSRDIPMDTLQHNHDEQIKPNYIPNTRLSSDYVLDYEKVNETKHKITNEIKHKTRFIDNVMVELQTPIFISILFFIFQMPIINSCMLKYLSFLLIYNEDGNFNFYGILLKSMLFGALFYSSNKFIDYIGDEY
jgi:hypothetical protein